jgi:predicted PurR-regulated permease PerM
LAGLAKFVPYIGPLLTGITTAVVAFFQADGNYFGLDQFTYALIVVIAAVLLDQLFDGLVTPRILGSTLGVHPAAVLVTAIIAAGMIGVIGLLLAAPVLASLQLFTRYTILKMLDQDPWPDPEPEGAEFDFSITEVMQKLRSKFKPMFKIRFPWSKGKKK